MDLYRNGNCLSSGSAYRTFDRMVVAMKEDAPVLPDNRGAIQIIGENCDIQIVSLEEQKDGSVRIVVYAHRNLEKERTSTVRLDV